MYLGDTHLILPGQDWARLSDVSLMRDLSLAIVNQRASPRFSHSSRLLGLAVLLSCGSVHAINVLNGQSVTNSTSTTNQFYLDSNSSFTNAANCQPTATAVLPYSPMTVPQASTYIAINNNGGQILGANGYNSIDFSSATAQNPFVGIGNNGTITGLTHMGPGGSLFTAYAGTFNGLTSSNKANAALNVYGSGLGYSGSINNIDHIYVHNNNDFTVASGNTLTNINSIYIDNGGAFTYSGGSMDAGIPIIGSSPGYGTLNINANYTTTAALTNLAKISVGPSANFTVGSGSTLNTINNIQVQQGSSSSQTNLTINGTVGSAAAGTYLQIYTATPGNTQTAQVTLSDTGSIYLSSLNTQYAASTGNTSILATGSSKLGQLNFVGANQTSYIHQDQITAKMQGVAGNGHTLGFATFTTQNTIKDIDKLLVFSGSTLTVNNAITNSGTASPPMVTSVQANNSNLYIGTNGSLAGQIWIDGSNQINNYGSLPGGTYATIIPSLTNANPISVSNYSSGTLGSVGNSMAMDFSQGEGTYAPPTTLNNYGTINGSVNLGNGSTNVFNAYGGSHYAVTGVTAANNSYNLRSGTTTVAGAITNMNNYNLYGGTMNINATAGTSSQGGAWSWLASNVNLVLGSGVSIYGSTFDFGQGGGTRSGSSVSGSGTIRLIGTNANIYFNLVNINVPIVGAAGANQQINNYYAFTTGNTIQNIDNMVVFGGALTLAYNVTTSNTASPPMRTWVNNGLSLTLNNSVSLAGQLQFDGGATFTNSGLLPGGAYTTIVPVSTSLSNSTAALTNANAISLTNASTGVIGSPGNVNAFDFSGEGNTYKPSITFNNYGTVNGLINFGNGATNVLNGFGGSFAGVTGTTPANNTVNIQTGTNTLAGPMTNIGTVYVNGGAATTFNINAQIGSSGTPLSLFSVPNNATGAVVNISDGVTVYATVFDMWYGGVNSLTSYIYASGTNKTGTVFLTSGGAAYAKQGAFTARITASSAAQATVYVQNNTWTTSNSISNCNISLSSNSHLTIGQGFPVTGCGTISLDNSGNSLVVSDNLSGNAANAPGPTTTTTVAATGTVSLTATGSLAGQLQFDGNCSLSNAGNLPGGNFTTITPIATLTNRSAITLTNSASGTLGKVGYNAVDFSSGEGTYAPPITFNNYGTVNGLINLGNGATNVFNGYGGSFAGVTGTTLANNSVNIQTGTNTLTGPISNIATLTVNGGAVTTFNINAQIASAATPLTLFSVPNTASGAVVNIADGMTVYATVFDMWYGGNSTLTSYIYAPGTNKTGTVSISSGGAAYVKQGAFTARLTAPSAAAATLRIENNTWITSNLISNCNLNLTYGSNVTISLGCPVTGCGSINLSNTNGATTLNISDAVSGNSSNSPSMITYMQNGSMLTSSATGSLEGQLQIDGGNTITNLGNLKGGNYTTIIPNSGGLTNASAITITNGSTGIIGNSATTVALDFSSGEGTYQPPITLNNSGVIYGSLNFGNGKGTLNINNSCTTYGNITNVGNININSPANWQVNNTITGYSSTNGIVVGPGATLTSLSNAQINSNGIYINGGTIAYGGGSFTTTGLTTALSATPAGTATLNFLVNFTSSTAWPNFSQINVLNGSALTYGSGTTLNGPINGSSGATLNVNIPYTFTSPITNFNTLSVAYPSSSTPVTLQNANGITATNLSSNTAVYVNGIASLGVVTGVGGSYTAVYANASGVVNIGSATNTKFSMSPGTAAAPSTINFLGNINANGAGKEFFTEYGGYAQYIFSNNVVAYTSYLNTNYYNSSLPGITIGLAAGATTASINASTSNVSFVVYSDNITVPIVGASGASFTVSANFTSGASISQMATVNVNNGVTFTAAYPFSNSTPANMSTVLNTNSTLNINTTQYDGAIGIASSATNTTMNVNASHTTTGAITNVATIKVNSPAIWQVNNNITGFNSSNGLQINTGANLKVNSGGSLTASSGIFVNGGTLTFNGGGWSSTAVTTAGSAVFNIMQNLSLGSVWPNFSQINVQNGATLTYGSGATLNGPITGSAGATLNVNIPYTFTNPISNFNTLAIAYPSSSTPVTLQNASAIAATNLSSNTAVYVSGIASLGTVTGVSASYTAVFANASAVINIASATQTKFSMQPGTAGAPSTINFLGNINANGAAKDFLTEYGGPAQYIFSNNVVAYTSNLNTNYYNSGNTTGITIGLAAGATNASLNASTSNVAFVVYSDNITVPIVGASGASFTVGANFTSGASISQMATVNVNTGVTFTAAYPFSNSTPANMTSVLNTNSTLTINTTQYDGAIGIASGATGTSLNITGNHSTTGNISNVASINVNAPALWSLNNAVTGYNSNGLSVNTGAILQLSTSGSLDSSKGLYLNGGTLQASSNLTTNFPITISSNAGSLAANGYSLNATGQISGGGLRAQGPGTLILNNVSNGQSSTTLNTGIILQVASDSNLGTSGGGLIFNNGTFSPSASYSSARPITLNGPAFLTTTASINQTFSGSITGPGLLSVTGAGSLSLTNSSANSNTGGVSLGVGSSLIINNDDTLGANSGVLTLNGSSLVPTAGLSSTRPIMLSGNATISGGSFNHNFAGSLSGSGLLSLNGSGTITLSGVNSNSGGIALGNTTTLSVANDNNLGASSSTLSFNNSTLLTTGAITSNRPLNLLGPGLLNTASYSSSFNGVISGAGALTLSGSGSISLALNNLNTGGVSVTGSTTLVIPADSSLGTSGTLNLSNGTLQTSGTLTSSRAWVLTASNTLNNAANTVNLSGNLSGGGSLTLAGTGPVSITGANSFGGLVVNSGANLYYKLNNSTTSSNLASLNNSGTTSLNNVASTGVPSMVVTSLTNAGIFNLNTALSATGVTQSAGTLNIATGVSLSTAAMVQSGGTVSASGTGQVLLTGNNASYTYSSATNATGLQTPLVGSLGTTNQTLNVNSSLNLTSPVQNIDAITVAANKTLTIASVVNSAKSPPVCTVNAGSIINLNPGGVRYGSLRGNSGTYNVNTSETTSGDIINVDAININRPAVWTVRNKVTGYVGGLTVAPGATLNVDDGGIINDLSNPIHVYGTLNVNGGLLNWAALTHKPLVPDEPDDLMHTPVEPSLSIHEGALVNLNPGASLKPKAIHLAGILNLSGGAIDLTALQAAPTAELIINSSIEASTGLKGLRAVSITPHNTLTLKHPQELKRLDNQGALHLLPGAKLDIETLNNGGMLKGVIRFDQALAELNLTSGSLLDQSTRFEGRVKHQQTVKITTQLNSPSYTDGTAFIQGFDTINLVGPAGALVLNERAEINQFQTLNIGINSHLHLAAVAKLQGRRIVNRGEILAIDGKADPSRDPSHRGAHIAVQNMNNHGTLLGNGTRLAVAQFNNYGAIGGRFMLVEQGQHLTLEPGTGWVSGKPLSLQGYSGSKQVLDIHTSLKLPSSNHDNHFAENIDTIRVKGIGTSVSLAANSLSNFKTLSLEPETELQLITGSKLLGETIELQGRLLLQGGQLKHTRLNVRPGAEIEFENHTAQPETVHEVEHLNIDNPGDCFTVRHPLTQVLLSQVHSQSRLSMQANMSATVFDNAGRVDIQGQRHFSGQFNQLDDAVLTFGIRGHEDYDQLVLNGRLHFSSQSVIAIRLEAQGFNAILHQDSFDLVVPAMGPQEGPLGQISGLPEVRVENAHPLLSFSPSLVDAHTFRITTARLGDEFMEAQAGPLALSLCNLGQTHASARELMAGLISNPVSSQQILGQFDLSQAIHTHYNVARAAEGMVMAKVFSRMAVMDDLRGSFMLSPRLRAAHYLQQESWIPRGFESRSDALDKLYNTSTVNIAPFIALKRSSQALQAGSAAYKVQTQGTGLLIDKVFKQAYRLGFGLVRSASGIKVDDFYHTEGKIRSWQGLLFANLTQRNLLLDGVLSFNQNRNITRRPLTLGNLVATSDFKSSQWTSQIRVGYLIRAKNVRFTPLISAQYARYHQSPYTQTGADIFNQSVKRLHVSTVQMGLGANISYEIDGHNQLIANVHAMAYRDDKSKPITTSAEFISGTGDYDSQSPVNRRASYSVGGGLSLLTRNGTLWSLGYDIELKSGFSSHAALLKLKAAF